MNLKNTKSAGRLAAVQAFYSTLIDGVQNSEEVIKNAISVLQNDGVKVKKTFSINIFNFALDEKTAIEAIIQKHTYRDGEISDGNKLLLAILFIAIAEFNTNKDTDTPIIISEYLAITSEFFDKNETAFVNAVLDKYVKENK